MKKHICYQEREASAPSRPGRRNPLVDEARKNYLLDGTTGTYNSIRAKGDDPHRRNTAASGDLEGGSGVSYFSKNRRTLHARQLSCSEGTRESICLTSGNKAGTNFGSKGSTKAEFLNYVEPLVIGKEPAATNIVVSRIKGPTWCANADAITGLSRKTDPDSPNWKAVLPPPTGN